MSLRRFANSPRTTLVATITNSATVLTVVSAAGFPALTPYTLILDEGEVTEEVVLVTNVAGTTLTVTRGYDSTTAFAHNSGAIVAHGVAAIDFRESNEHINTSAGVHGIAGSVVGTSDTQSLTNKTLGTGTVISAGTTINDAAITNPVIQGGKLQNLVKLISHDGTTKIFVIKDTGDAVEYGYLDKDGVFQAHRLRAINTTNAASALILDTPTGASSDTFVVRKNGVQVASIKPDGTVVAPNVDIQAWQNLTLTSGRVTYDSVPQYRKIGTNKVAMRGTIRKTDFSAITDAPYLLATLPVGYRPTGGDFLERFIGTATLGGAGTNGACRMEISGDGQINVWTQDSPTWVGIDGEFWLD